MLQKPPTQQSTPYAKSAAPAIGHTIPPPPTGKAMLQPFERALVVSFSQGPVATDQYHTMILHLDASWSLQVANHCEPNQEQVVHLGLPLITCEPQRFSRLDLPAPASQTNFMAH